MGLVSNLCIMGSCDNAKTACGFATVNFLLHGGLLGFIIWYLLFQVESDVENASFEVTFAGVNVVVDPAMLQDVIASGENSNEFNKLMDLIMLVVQLVGLIPIGLGTLSCLLVMLGFLC